MVNATIWDFQVCKILLPDWLGKSKMHHSAKFCQNWFIRCGNIAIFRIFKMAPPPS